MLLAVAYVGITQCETLTLWAAPTLYFAKFAQKSMRLRKFCFVRDTPKASLKPPILIFGDIS